MWEWHDMGWGAGGWLMILMMVVVVVAVVVALIFLIRALVGRDGPNSATEAGDELRATAKETPEQLLKRRYVAGEIDREEYLAKRKDLES